MDDLKIVQWRRRGRDIEFVAEPVYDWAPGSELCQNGRCCKQDLVSVGKDAICPFCGKQVYLT